MVLCCRVRAPPASSQYIQEAKELVHIAETTATSVGDIKKGGHIQDALYTVQGEIVAVSVI